jgi:hypothetical protein
VLNYVFFKYLIIYVLNYVLTKYILYYVLNVMLNYVFTNYMLNYEIFSGIPTIKFQEFDSYQYEDCFAINICLI